MRSTLTIAILLSALNISHSETKDEINHSTAIQNRQAILDFVDKVMKTGKISSLKEIEKAFSTELHSNCIKKDDLGENRHFCSYIPVERKNNSIYLESYKSFGEDPMPISRGFLTIGIDAKATCIKKEGLQEIFGVQPRPSENLPATDFFGGAHLRADYQNFTIHPKLFSKVEFINGCAALIILNINI